MKHEWRERIIATTLYTIVAITVAWFNREALYYLDAWIIFVSIAIIPLLFLLGYFLWDRAHPDAGIRWKKGLAVSFTVVISLAVVWLTFSALFISFFAWMTPVNNVRKYK